MGLDYYYWWHRPHLVLKLDFPSYILRRSSMHPWDQSTVKWLKTQNEGCWNLKSNFIGASLKHWHTFDFKHRHFFMFRFRFQVPFLQKNKHTIIGLNGGLTWRSSKASQSKCLKNMWSLNDSCFVHPNRRAGFFVRRPEKPNSIDIHSENKIIDWNYCQSDNLNLPSIKDTASWLKKAG